MFEVITLSTPPVHAAPATAMIPTLVAVDDEINAAAPASVTELASAPPPSSPATTILIAMLVPIWPLFGVARRNYLHRKARKRHARMLGPATEQVGPRRSSPWCLLRYPSRLRPMRRL